MSTVEYITLWSANTVIELHCNQSSQHNFKIQCGSQYYFYVDFQQEICTRNFHLREEHNYICGRNDNDVFFL